MSHADQSLIVGAGPVGLGAALFLARQGHVPRVVEMRNEPATQSKALAVNPRTLEILEPTGVTARMLEIGLPIRGASIYRRGRVLAAVSFDGVHPRYPFLLALSQATSERLLARALEAAGGHVERGVKMVACRSVTGGAEATLEHLPGGDREVTHSPWMLAADGARSVARDQMWIDFTGTTFAREWHLADVPLRTPLAADRAHIFLLDGGAFLFMIRVVDEVLNGLPGDPLWRVIANRPEPLSRLVKAEQTGRPVWASSFRIAHRINSTFAAEGVYFAGDAAHIHSPFGARGMNLGLEDAWVFAELVRTDRLRDYDRLRHAVDRRVVHRVELVSKIVSAESPLFGIMRSLFPWAIHLPFVRRGMRAMLTGLDHDLPQMGPTSRATRAAAAATCGKS